MLMMPNLLELEVQGPEDHVKERINRVMKGCNSIKLIMHGQCNINVIPIMILTHMINQMDKSPIDLKDQKEVFLHLISPKEMLNSNNLKFLLE